LSQSKVLNVGSLSRGNATPTTVARWILDEESKFLPDVKRRHLVLGLSAHFELKADSVRKALRHLQDVTSVHGNSTLNQDDLTAVGGMARALAQNGTPLTVPMMHQLVPVVTDKHIRLRTAYKLCDRYPDLFGRHDTAGSSVKRKSAALGRISAARYAAAVDEVARNCHYGRHAVVAYDGFAFWYAKGMLRTCTDLLERLTTNRCVDCRTWHLCAPHYRQCEA
jgi:hypothetical protein